jgi:hypothetical protein
LIGCGFSHGRHRWRGCWSPTILLRAIKWRGGRCRWNVAGSLAPPEREAQ